MKVIIVALAFVAVAAAAAVEYEPPKILRSSYDQTPEGGYEFGYESEDGSIREEKGEVKSVVNEDNKPQDVVVVRGSYQYVNSDGKLELVKYYADEKGYYAEGDSIPKPVSR